MSEQIKAIEKNTKQDLIPEKAQLNLAAGALGAEVLFASDDFFAPKENLIQPGRGIFIADRYTDRGKWMDGWESRRKREPGHDYAIVRLAFPGQLSSVDIDTNHFLGNHPPHASLWGLYHTDDEPPHDESPWVRLLPKSPLHAGSQNLFSIDSPLPFTHVKLNIYPDGGVARLKVYGRVQVDWLKRSAQNETNLIGLENGGEVVTQNDAFFSPGFNLLKASTSDSMADGWETRRRREPGHDWIILALRRPGSVKRVVVDTRHFKGNYPDAVSLEALRGPPKGGFDSNESWVDLLPAQKLGPHQEHTFQKELRDIGPITHVRMSIYPDGGVSRLRLWGTFDLKGSAPQWDDNQWQQALTDCCHAPAWVDGMQAKRPFADLGSLLAAATDVFQKLDEHDWLAAFRGHPQIGDRKAARGQAAQEQKSTQGASQALLQELMDYNRRYEAKFGFIFIVCASGLDSQTMLDLIKIRLQNTREQELDIAAKEQQLITRLRLTALIGKTAENL